jgi:hypothetical protein
MAINVEKGGASAPAAPAGASWMKRGTESAAIAKQEEQAVIARKDEQYLMWRFYLKPGTEADITLVDGDLNPEGFLLPPRYYEHTMYIGGKYVNYVCPEKTNPSSGDKCPICEEPSERAALVALFTCIDHTPHTGKNGVVHKDRAKLIVAKSRSFEMLNTLATKMQGLAGMRFSVSRSKDEKSPSIGDTWIPMGKSPIEELKAKYVQELVDPKTNAKTKSTIFVPADYEKEVIYRTGDELRLLGLGKPQMGTNTTPMGGSGEFASHL